MKRYPAPLALAFVLSLSGCSKTTSTSDGTKVTVSSKGDGSKLEVKTPESGTTTITIGEAGVALPDTFPKDLLVPAGAKPTQTWTSEQGLHVVFVITESLADANKFFQESLKNNGWKITGTFTAPDSLVISADKENRHCGITANKNETQTLLSVIVTPEVTKP